MQVVIYGLSIVIQDVSLLMQDYDEQAQVLPVRARCSNDSEDVECMLLIVLTKQGVFNHFMQALKENPIQKGETHSCLEALGAYSSVFEQLLCFENGAPRDSTVFVNHKTRNPHTFLVVLPLDWTIRVKEMQRCYRELPDRFFVEIVKKLSETPTCARNITFAHKSATLHSLTKGNQ